MISLKTKEFWGIILLLGFILFIVVGLIYFTVLWAIGIILLPGESGFVFFVFSVGCGFLVLCSAAEISNLSAALEEKTGDEKHEKRLMVQGKKIMKIRGKLEKKLVEIQSRLALWDRINEDD